MLENLPSILFATVSVLGGALALADWSAHRRLARSAAVLTVVAALCFVTNRAWLRYSIRVDLLLSIPLVSLAALAAGMVAALRPPAVARALGAALGLSGALSLVWFAYAIHASAVEDARITALYDEGNRLFWNESIRCQGNFEKRFGPMDRTDDVCLGDLVVKTRSPNAYPFTRVVLNDRGEAWLLFSPAPEVERPVTLSGGVLALMKRASSGQWSGEGDAGFGPTRTSLLALKSGRCEAKIVHHASTSALTLERVELPQCRPAANPAVTFSGAWGAISAEPSAMRRLLQIWLWSENSGKGKGVLLNDIAPGGLHREFIFLKHFRAVRVDDNQWNLLLEGPDVPAPATISMIIEGDKARVRGPQPYVGPDGEAVLERKAVVTDPRIELVPVRDTALFERYLKSALFNLPLSWTAP
jgi:hypothetical protein